MNYSLADRLANLHDYTDNAFPFIDRFSRFSVTYPRSRPMGLGPLHPRATMSTYYLCDSLLWLWMDEGGTWTPLSRQKMNSWPWLAVEHGTYRTPSGEVRIESRSVFRTSDRLVCEFSFTSHASEPVELAPRWTGKVNPDSIRYMGGHQHNAKNEARATFLKRDINSVIGGLLSHEETDLPAVGFRLIAEDDVAAWTGPEPAWMYPENEYTEEDSIDLDGLPEAGGFFAFAPKDKTISLEPGEVVTLRFQLDVTFAQSYEGDISFEDAGIESLSFEEMIADSEKNFASAVGADTLPDTGKPGMDQHILRSRVALLRDGIAGGGGEFGDDIACLCSPDESDFSCSFFWDTLFSGVAIADFNQQYAKGAIRTAFVRHMPANGSTPERKFNYAPKQRGAQNDPQSPVAAWALSEYLKKYDDKEFLEEMYPILHRNHTFWEVHSDADADGLAEFRWSGQAGDDSPLWDYFAGSFDNVGGCAWLPPVASVHLNCFLYKDAFHMLNFAKTLGNEEHIEYYTQRREDIADRLKAICYVDEDKRYWDYFHGTETHSKVKTFFMFWPLYVGLPMDDDVVKDLIENEMLDPERFFGAVPFPSASYEEDYYDANGYWRGKAWPHICYWMLQTLECYGYSKEAKEGARRLIAYNAQTRGFLENFTTDLHQMDPTYKPDSASKPDYNWGCAAFYLIATDFLG